MVNSKLLKLIALVESGNNQFAIRFEPSIYGRLSDNKYYSKQAKLLDVIRTINECSYDTAKMIFSTSWGKYQIMGFNLYTVCKLNMSVGWFLCDIKTQEMCCIRFLESIKINSDKVIEDLEALVIAKEDIRKSYEKLLDFTNAFKNYLTENKEAYSCVIEFITKYNGSRFISDAFYSYLLRLLYNYEKIKKEG